MAPVALVVSPTPHGHNIDGVEEKWQTLTWEFMYYPFLYPAIRVHINTLLNDYGCFRALVRASFDTSSRRRITWHDPPIPDFIHLIKISYVGQPDGG